MKNLTIISCIPLSITEIEQFEVTFKVQLPKFLKRFLLKYNGAIVYEDSVQKKCALQNFLALYSNVDISIAGYMPMIQNDHGDEYTIHRQDLIPIAIDNNHRLYCVSIGKADYAQVYKLLYEHEVELHAIGTFESFINNLYRDTEADKLVMLNSATRILYTALYELKKDTTDYVSGVEALKQFFKRNELEYQRWEKDIPILLTSSEVCLKEILDFSKVQTDDETKARQWLKKLVHDLIN